jgi:hypothetical protein
MEAHLYRSARCSAPGSVKRALAFMSATPSSRCWMVLFPTCVPDCADRKSGGKVRRLVDYYSCTGKLVRMKA